MGQKKVSMFQGLARKYFWGKKVFIREVSSFLIEVPLTWLEGKWAPVYSITPSYSTPLYSTGVGVSSKQSWCQ